MAWFKIDDRSAFHHKVLSAGNGAWGALCRMGAYSSERGSDGRLPESVAITIASGDELDALVSSGLLEKVDGGYLIHDFLHYNPSAKQLAKLRNERAISGSVGGKQKSSKRLANAKQTLSKDVAKVCPIPIPIPEVKSLTPLVPLAGGGPLLASPSADTKKTRKLRVKRAVTGVPPTGTSEEDLDNWCVGLGIPKATTNPAVLRMVRWARGKDARKADWKATWDNWEEDRFGRESGSYPVAKAPTDRFGRPEPVYHQPKLGGDHTFVPDFTAEEMDAWEAKRRA